MGGSSFLPFSLPLFLASLCGSVYKPTKGKRKEEEEKRKKKRLSAGSKRAMHSLHHHDVTRPSRPRQVVSCSSRSDGSKKRTEPTKEVKSLICQTKQGGFLFSYFSLSSFFSSSSLPARNLFTFLDATQCSLPNTQSHATRIATEPQQTISQNRVTRIISDFAFSS